MVKLPHARSARIDARKVRDYLLSEIHPVGRFKYRFFRRLGYSRATWQDLRVDIRVSAESGVVIAMEDTAYGTKFVVRGQLTGPTGREAQLMTVWIQESDRTPPRLVTAYPGAS